MVKNHGKEGKSSSRLLKLFTAKLQHYITAKQFQNFLICGLASEEMVTFHQNINCFFNVASFSLVGNLKKFF